MKKKEVVATPSVQHKLYTTHDAAKLLQMDASTVSKWIDKGILMAFRTPGGHRRIQAQHLVAFLKHYKMPLPEELVAYSDQQLPGPTTQAILQLGDRVEASKVAYTPKQAKRK